MLMLAINAPRGRIQGKPWSAPPLTPMDLAGGGEGGEDRLTSLPDDLLLRILRGLPSTADAAQTSLLSRRWVRLWAGIPEIWFRGPAVPARVHAALAAYAAHAGPPVRDLSVVSDAPLDDEAVGVVELPCLDHATKIELRLGCLGLAFPYTGVFTKLETLFLENVRFNGHCKLGDAVSSSRCPSLRRLTVGGALGMPNLTISSQSLVALSLAYPQGLRRLVVVAPMLVSFYFSVEKQKFTASISAPRLKRLYWAGRFEPRFLQRAHLRELATNFSVYGRDGFLNYYCLRLFQHFKVVSLQLLLMHPANSVNSHEYLMDGITFLPDVKNLLLSFVYGAHAFGPSVFHLLRLCAGIRRLKLKLMHQEGECPLDCTCDQRNGWKSENIFLDLLEKAEISGIKGVEHEAVFLKQLFRWATALKKMTITFDPLVAVSDNLCKEIVSFSRSETCVEIYLYRNGRRVLFTPVV